MKVILLILGTLKIYGKPGVIKWVCFIGCCGFIGRRTFDIFYYLHLLLKGCHHCLYSKHQLSGLVSTSCPSFGVHYDYFSNYQWCIMIINFSIIQQLILVKLVLELQVLDSNENRTRGSRSKIKRTLLELTRALREFMMPKGIST